MPSASSILTAVRNKIFSKYSVIGSVERITSQGTLNTSTAQFDNKVTTTFSITYIDNSEKRNAQPINLFDAQAPNQQIKRSKTQSLKSIIILADENYTPLLEDVFIDVDLNRYKMRQPSIIRFQGTTIAYEIDLND